MNNLPNSKRQVKDYKLETVAGAGEAIDIPRSPSVSSGSAKSAPPGSGYISLIPSVMDESEALNNSISSSRSSLVERHRQAAGGGLARYNSYGGVNTTEDYVDKPENIDSEYVKIQERNQMKRLEHTTTDLQTFSHILKGNIGTGLLALPYAVKNSGIIIGPFGLLLMGIIATHCMVVLVKVANELCRRNGMTCLNYAESAAVVAGEYTKNKKIIKGVGIVVNIFLIITQFGFCCVYFIFMADSLNEVFCTSFDVNLGQRVWIAILLVPVVVLSWIRNLEELSSFSLIANFCILFSMCVILYAVINSFMPGADDGEKAKALDIHNLTIIGTVKSIALFFGGVVYAFEGIGMVLPLENKMRNPSNAKPVIYGAMIIVTLLYTVFGTMGYLVYGSEIKSSITLNLHSPNIAVEIIFIITRFFYAYAIFASFLLQFYVPMDFLEPAFYGLIKVDRLEYRFPRHHKKLALLIQMLFRSAIVILTAAIAVAVPDLGDLIALIGAFASSALAFIFPALLDLLTFWPSRQEWRELCQCRQLILRTVLTALWTAKNFAIIALGVIGLVLGTYASIANIVVNIGKPADSTCNPLWLHH